MAIDGVSVERRRPTFDASCVSNQGVVHRRGPLAHKRHVSHIRRSRTRRRRLKDDGFRSSGVRALRRGERHVYYV